MNRDGRPRIWSDAVLDAAWVDRLAGATWPQVWQRHGHGLGSENGLRTAVMRYGLGVRRNPSRCGGWSDDVLEAAHEDRENGATMAELWARHGGGVRTPRALVGAVVEWRKRQGRCLPTEADDDTDAAAAILSRPPARIAVRLAQLPACELRLCEWPYP